MSYGQNKELDVFQRMVLLTVLYSFDTLNNMIALNLLSVLTMFIAFSNGFVEEVDAQIVCLRVVVILCINLINCLFITFVIKISEIN